MRPIHEPIDLASKSVDRSGANHLFKNMRPNSRKLHDKTLLEPYHRAFALDGPLSTHPTTEATLTYHGSRTTRDSQPIDLALSGRTTTIIQSTRRRVVGDERMIRSVPPVSATCYPPSRSNHP